jgi:methylenetetrahydrofolate dehydrogenase (NADP+) / methenyltetrahydrofolate cyclohydrolase
MKSLNGAELAGFIKERQAKQVRAMRQAQHVAPKLAIIRTNPDPVVDSYMRIKQQYGEDIQIEVEVHTIDQAEALGTIEQLNEDESVHGIIVQLPLPDSAQTDEILNAVAPQKDVDGLRSRTEFDAPTPMAINWLLAGYNIELKNKHIVIIGQGRLVGAPLAKMWRNSGLDVQTADRFTDNIELIIKRADVLVSAAGKPGLVTADMLKVDTVVVDAGVSTDSNGLVGDIAPEVRERHDLTITPEKGGVGPLTVAALFDNVIRAARAVPARQAGA